MPTLVLINLIISGVLPYDTLSCSCCKSPNTR